MINGVFFKNKKILITGGVGFIGSNLAKRLVKLNSHVTIVDSLIPEYGGNLFNIESIREKVDVNICDVRDLPAMSHLIQGQDVLFNLAGQTSHMDSMKDPHTDLEINSKAQLSILEAVKIQNKSIRIVYASTRQIYGKPEYLPVNEKHPLNPVDVNGINKLAGEQYHLLYHKVYGIATTVLRLTNTIGPCMRIKDARQTFLGVWIRHLLENKVIEVWGGEQLRDFNDVEDVVDALLLAAHHDQAIGQIYNLGNDDIVSLKDLAKLLIELHQVGDYTIKEFPYDRKKIDIGDYHTDFKKIQSELNWTPKYKLKETLLRTINYYKEFLEKYIS